MQALICDNGTGYLKVGWSSSNFPDLTVPCLIGRPNRHFQSLTGEMGREYVGHDAMKFGNSVDLFRPLEHGIIEDWEGMLKLWEYTFLDQMSFDFGNTRILLSEAPMNPVKNREVMCEHMFETFGFEGLKVEIQATLALYAQGLMTGLVVDSGEGVTHCIPIYKGSIINNAIERINVAGRTLTAYMLKLLGIRGYHFDYSFDFELVREIKEKSCFVSPNIKEDRELSRTTTALEQDFQLPDGSWVRVGRERFEAPEALFNPGLLQIDEPGFAELVFNSLMKAPIDNRKDLMKSIVMSGGSTMFPGMVNRVTKELKKLHKDYRERNRTIHEQEVPKVKIKVEDPPYRRYSVFIGAAAYANILQEQPEAWVSKADWEEKT
eukprot:CAMPEP_0202439728 /NCGR_PEP_ID=MMETSP1345-20130828/36315_1 /ASSEMBLY_ACC=CAM_ASM_000843 /TAXON_ID=342563 /ORGANISM="Fabrea Fabrea salina" /LENGTH=377 /DNA_ID=CAMNT_0049054273 /DNA_START=952 /DNA_END=2085 /DNA_ORIENTATION=-